MSEPAWIAALRLACKSLGSQTKAGQKVGYSAGVVNAVLKGTYKGDLVRVQRAVEGALMRATVDCPVLGEIPQQRCIEHQRAPFRATNPSAVQLYRACRGGCPHSLIAGAAGKDQYA